MSNMNVVVWSPQSRRTKRSSPISPEQWEEHREHIWQLYIEKNHTLEEVVQLMQSKDLQCSRRQLLTQLCKWGMRKHRSSRAHVGSTLSRASTTQYSSRRDPAHTSKVDTSRNETEGTSRSYSATEDQLSGQLEAPLRSQFSAMSVSDNLFMDSRSNNNESLPNGRDAYPSEALFATGLEYEPSAFAASELDWIDDLSLWDLDWFDDKLLHGRRTL